MIFSVLLGCGQELEPHICSRVTGFPIRSGPRFAKMSSGIRPNTFRVSVKRVAQ
ncbi:hypothetical protein DPMN_030144 [Dreissena polymorpha]|uniref:Uncharacterized protein n=1 Tax=Dreissena polymorpha TaxID=45954 RepID=A0A9D4LZW6_DREPO|nr:hypothetical protein DPMN_030144 [Dreissena polymorpha]